MTQKRKKKSNYNYSTNNKALIFVNIFLVLGIIFLSITERKPSQIISYQPSVTLSPTPVPIFKITGYYKIYEGIDWGNKKVTCDSLLVTGGNDKLIQKYKDFLNSGNDVNAYDKNKNLLLNIEIPQDQKLASKIKNSSYTNQIEISLREKIGGADEVPKCFSFFDIISVN